MSVSYTEASTLGLGRTRRLRRLFRHDDGRAILTPIDHGLYSGPMQGIEDPAGSARRLIPGSDGLLVSPGFARHISAVLPSDRALVLRVGVCTDLSPVQGYEAVFAGIETALRCDADAMVHTLYMGTTRDQDAIRNAGSIVEAADRYGMPVLLEFLPATDDWQPRQVAQWARLGFELGASAIKTIYTGDVDSFARVVAGCPIPILIAGGPVGGTLADLLTTVADAVAAGAAGLAIGRRVWQAADPAHLLELLNGIVHHRLTVEEALTAE
jgi:DhnA family fructose-bisphosphate aldolase class Ia